MKKTIFIVFSLLSLSLFAQKETLHMNNRVLLDIQGKKISVLDLEQEMKNIFDHNFAHLKNSPEARLEFYQMSWKRVLADMLHNELMLLDAKTKKITVSDGEIREQLEKRFGPNITFTLKQHNITLDEAWDLIKKEMTIERMKWFYIHAKAMQAITPQTIKDAFQIYKQQNPPLEQWHYQVISISNHENLEDIAKKAHSILSALDDLSQAQELLQPLIEQNENVVITISPKYSVSHKEISKQRRNILQALDTHSLSAPIEQKGKQKTVTYRLFYLHDYEKGTPPSFEAMHDTLKNNLMQKVVLQETENYYTYLRTRYGYDTKLLQQSIPADFQPFSLQ